MQRGNREQSKNGKPSQKRRAEAEDAESSQIDHETKDPGELATLAMPEPGGVNLHHARSAERLQIAVQSADGYEKAEHPRKRGGPKQDVHQNGPRGSNQ